MERLRLWPRVQQYHHPTQKVTFGCHYVQGHYIDKTYRTQALRVALHAVSTVNQYHLRVHRHRASIADRLHVSRAKAKA